MADNHILIIEDERKIAELLRDYLIADGYQTTCFDRGDNALESIRNAIPSLILLDLMLPGVDGITVCREIRKFSEVPIIMITAKVDEIDRLIGLEVGADDYICKPFSPREVIARVKAVLRRTNLSPRESPHCLLAGDIVVNPDTKQATVKGQALHLTPSEFGLLSTLVGAPGRVFSRSELIDRVQGYQFEGYDRTIDSHIKNLRKKISEYLPGQEVIQTIYGFGYKLQVERKSKRFCSEFQR